MICDINNSLKKYLLGLNLPLSRESIAEIVYQLIITYNQIFIHL
jgi:hypothetical protein